jgi:hypothetical protein
MMKRTHILYWALLSGWGLGQAVDWVIGHTIGTSIMVGEIGGVIYTDNTVGLLIVGIGGFVGGLINGILLFRAIATEIGPDHAREVNPIFILAGWALAFVIKEETYSLATASNTDLFYGLFICSSVILGSLIAAGVGGGLTLVALDYSFADSITGVLGWGIGLILGSFAGLVVSDIVFAYNAISLPFDINSAVSNLLGGFVNGCVSAIIGGWVMAWLARKNPLSMVEEIPG